LSALLDGKAPEAPHSPFPVWKPCAYLRGYLFGLIATTPQPSLGALPSLVPQMVGVVGPGQGSDDEDHSGAVNYQAEDISCLGDRT
jgi:hypothetical protein